MKDCPNCNQHHNNDVITCDCGYNFMPSTEPVESNSVKNPLPDIYFQISTADLERLRHHSSVIRVLCVLWLIAIIPVVLSVYGCPLIIFFLLAISGCQRRTSSGGQSGASLSYLLLIGFPIGTAIGLIGIINISRGKAIFEHQMKHKDIVEALRQRDSGEMHEPENTIELEADSWRKIITTITIAFCIIAALIGFIFFFFYS